MEQFDRIIEQFRVAGQDLANKIKELIHEGNVRRIIIKDERGHTFVEIPLSVATVSVVLAPVLAAVAAIATVVAKFDVVVERAHPAAPPAAPPASPGASTGDKSHMAEPAPQPAKDTGDKLEGSAGPHDSQGG